MELLEFLSIAKKRLWVIVAITITITIISAAVSLFVMDRIYEGKVTLIIGRSQNNETEKVRYDDILMYQKLVKTYSELAVSRLVIDETMAKLNYDSTYEKFQNKLKVTSKGDTQILEISMQDQNPELAALLANTLSTVFIEKVKLIMNSEDVKIMDKAYLPQKPVKPLVALYIAIALTAGLLLSLAIVFLLEYLDNTIKNDNDVEQHLSMTILASIPYVQEVKK